jgi:hypothetical protein
MVWPIIVRSIRVGSIRRLSLLSTRNLLFQFFKPVLHDIDLRRCGLGLLGGLEHQEALAVWGHVVIGGRCRSAQLTDEIIPPRLLEFGLAGSIGLCTTFIAPPDGSIQHGPFAFLGNELLEMSHDLVPPRHERLDFALAEVGLGFLQDLVTIQRA